MTTSIELVDNKFKFSPTGLTIYNHPTFEEWLDYFNKLIQTGESIGLAIGDMLNYGFDHYPDEVTQLFGPDSDHPLYENGTLRNLKYITHKWPVMSRARYAEQDIPLTFYQETASLPDGQREEVLQEALDNGHDRDWIRDKKRELKNEQRDYSPLVDKIIRLIQKLEQVYPPGVDLIKEYINS